MNYEHRSEKAHENRETASTPSSEISLKIARMDSLLAEIEEDIARMDSLLAEIEEDAQLPAANTRDLDEF